MPGSVSSSPLSSLCSLCLFGEFFIPKITDFGLAKLLESEVAAAAPGHATQTGAVLGTPSYMAPEQAAGKHGTIGPAVDVYALGAILYEVLTGRPPFHGETPLDTLEQARTQEPLPPSRLRPRLARDLETICLKCLEKEPSKRYASAGDLAGDLRRFLAGEPIRARPVRAWQHAVKWAKRRPAAAVLCAVGVLLATVGFPGVTWLWLQRGAALANEAKQRQRAEAGAAATLIALAHRDWLTNDVGQARKHLDECPPEYRDERWHYLHRACHAELLSFGRTVQHLSALAWSPDGRHLATASRDNSITIRDAASGQALLTWKGHRSAVIHLVFSPTREQLISAAWSLEIGFLSSKTDVKGWDAATGNLLRTSPQLQIPIQSALSKDGRLAVLGKEGVKILDAFTGRELLDLGPREAPPVGTAFSHDGNLLASTEHGGAVRVWDAAGGKLLHTHREPATKTFSRSPAFSRDGQRLAWGIGRREENVHHVRIWDWSAGQELMTLTGHTARVTAVDFHPSGRYLASASEDFTVMIWDTFTGREVLTLRGHTVAVYNLAFSPDGQRLASVDSDGTVKVWDTSSLGAAP